MDERITEVGDWRSLTGDEKRARVLAKAGELFAVEGVAFPMPELAKALGIGVGSLYRQVGSKDDVLAALVVQRLERFNKEYVEIASGGGDPLEALLRAVDYTLSQTMQDRIAKISFELALDHPDVLAQRTESAKTLAKLVDDAKAAGGVRGDADVMDLRIMFRLAREAEHLQVGAGRRLAQLVVDGLRYQP